MFLLSITAWLNASVELVCYYCRTKPILTPLIALLPGFVLAFFSKRIKFSSFVFLQDLKQARSFSLKKHKPHTKQQSWWILILPTKYGSHLERWENSRSSSLPCQGTSHSPDSIFSKGKEWSGEIYQPDLSMPEGYASVPLKLCVQKYHQFLDQLKPSRNSKRVRHPHRQAEFWHIRQTKEMPNHQNQEQFIIS